MEGQTRDTMEMSRRRVLWSGGALLVGAAAWSSQALAATKLLRTPAQALGPFYPDQLPLDTDNDLVTVAGRAERAMGQITHLTGRITDAHGQPVRGAQVDIWQCDALGRYIHTADVNRGRRDPNFQGYGKTRTNDDGWYRFRTIKPVTYPGRAPHIHFAIKSTGSERLVTQMYIAGAPENGRDFLLNNVRNEEARRSLIVALQPLPDHEPHALRGQFDLVLGNGWWPFKG